MIDWKPGLLRGPDGPCRELPQRFVSSAIWVTRDGQLRRRFYNVVERKWHWAQDRLEVTLDDEGRLGYSLHGNFVALERVIALAWCRRHPDSPNAVRVAEGKPITARHIAWAKAEEGEPHAARVERFHPLRWRCGLIACAGRGYELSDSGHLRAPDGAVTGGFWFAPLETRMAAVQGVGLIDLRAAREDAARVELPPRLEWALSSIARGRAPCDAAIDVAESTMWSYYAQAAERCARADELRRVHKLVAPDLWRLLLAMRDDPLLGGPLTPLMEAVRSRLRPHGHFARGGYQFEQLRLARLAVLRTP